MCGTALEVRRPVGAPRTTPPPEAARAEQNAAAPRTPTGVPAGAGHGVPPNSGAANRVPPTGVPATGGPSAAGPSFLGLNQPWTAQPLDNEEKGTRPRGQTAEPTFSGFDTFLEPDDTGISVRGIVLLLMLLVALGAGGWWAYAHYSKGGTAAGENAESTQAPAETPQQSANGANPSRTAPEQSPENSAGAQSAGSSENSNAAANANSSAAAPAATAPSQTGIGSSGTGEQTAERERAARAKADASERSRRSREVARADVKPARPAQKAATTSDKGEAEFRRGEAYLYGHGVPKNCDAAVKNLKAASAKQSAKARSAFGTMYATGHCVPRDLPMSYSWFAQALRVDPNNQILEKDLTAVWNQMTLPERQMATKAKQ